MRNVIGWRYQLVQSLRSHWAADSRLTPGAVCEIELGLTLLETILPGEPAEALWVVLTGYPFSAFPRWTPEQRLMIGAARHLLSAYKSPFPWKRSLERYQRLDGRVRGYEIAADGTFRRLPVSVCAERWDIYAQTLRQAPAHSRADVRWAKAGDYGFYDRRRRESVTIPLDLPLPGRPKGHDLSGRTERTPISVSWEDLRATAAWMDDRLTQANLISPAAGRRTSWERDIQRVELHVFDRERTALRPSTLLTLDGMTHLIGMVSSGKSTLMDVLAVWAARHGRHVTIVVGDVVSALSRAELFRQLGLAVAPILGSSNRERHLNRLHRVAGLVDPTNPLSMPQAGFDWLSTACPLDGLRSTNRPLQMGAQPCLRLIPVAGEDDEQDAPPQACPLYSACPFHQAQRDLVDARIWIATPASLVYTRIAPQLNGIRLRFAELVYRRSDLVIVDEADQVQIQLDHMFSPSQILVSRSHDAWLNRISNQVNSRINQEGRGQLGEERVAAWYQAHDIAQRAASHLYARLLSNAELQKHIAKDYFTAWLILEKLALEISGAKPEQREDHARYRELLDIFQAFIDDPLGERPTQLPASPTNAAPPAIGLDEPTRVVIRATPVPPTPPPALADRSTPELALASYFNAINRQEYDRAYGYWEQAPDNADPAAFARGFGDTRAVRLYVGLPVFVGVGAGNAYAALPTLLVILHTDGRLETLQGCYVAHRVNIDPAQRDWGLKQAEIAPGAPDLQGLLQPAGQCAEANTSGGQSFDDTTAPINTLASYYDAIARQDYARAYGYWRAAPDGADAATFAAGFAGTAAVRIYVDPAFASEGAAGSQFAQSAALVVSRQNDGALNTLAGCYTLSRPNAGNFDPPAEQPWLLHSAQIAEVAQSELVSTLAAQVCGS